MSWEQFWFVLIGCVLAMWACRVIPLFLLKGRELPPRLAQALGFIPPAAFAALVANDLLNPGMFDAGVWPAAIPLVAAVASALVAREDQVASVDRRGWRGRLRGARLLRCVGEGQPWA